MLKISASLNQSPLFKRRNRTLDRLKRDRWLYVLLLPGLLYFIVFKYLPMWGVLIAFQDYHPMAGLSGSQWVGLKHFERFFSESSFWMLLRNTALLAVYNLLFYFPMPIIFALLLNEVRVQYFKSAVQTMIYIPHFVSWVVVVGILHVFLTTEGGLINEALVRLGIEKIPFLLSQEWFRPLIILEIIWKETGWGTILFLAALAGIDPTLYEAAKMDGANRWRQMWHITLPALKTVTVILLILRLGNFLDTGFEQIFLMLNSMNRNVGEVFDTYVYTNGIVQGHFSFSTAVGLFKSVVGLMLVVGANYFAKKIGEEGLY